MRHVGSARNDADLGLLIEQARRLLADAGQGVLDLALTPMTVKAVMVSPGRSAGLFADRWRVLKTSSGPLYEALAGVGTGLGFGVMADDDFRDLVIARIAEPTGLFDIDRVLAGLGQRVVSLSTRKRTLRSCRQGSCRDLMAAACFEHASPDSCHRGTSMRARGEGLED